MPKISAGLILFRKAVGRIEVLLVHPGGPFWKNKDDGVWTFPRGEVESGEDLESVARREFHEETGHVATGDLIPLGSIHQKSGKAVHAWAVEGNLDPATIRSNTITLEWPPKSGRIAQFPEIDRAEFFDLTNARQKIRESESPFLDTLELLLHSQHP